MGATSDFRGLRARFWPGFRYHRAYFLPLRQSGMAKHGPTRPPRNLDQTSIRPPLSHRVPYYLFHSLRRCSPCCYLSFCRRVVFQAIFATTPLSYHQSCLRPSTAVHLMMSMLL
jgi:hypothetical protein